jgi:hypothetical protein
MVLGIVLAFVIVLVAACGPIAEGTAEVPETATSAPPTPGPGVAVNTAPVPSATPGTSSTTVLETAELTAFAEAWSAGDIDAIRAFYTPDAVSLSAEQVVALQHGPVPVQVADEAFAEQVGEHQGLTMRILGEPIRVFDKLVGFAFRWQDGSSGYDGVALLRYEDGLIWMHTYAISSERTANPADDSVLTPVDLGPLMDAWSSGQAEVVQPFYTEGAGVFSDEDIALSLEGKVLSAEDLAGGHLTSEVRENGGPWGMTAAGQPLRLGDLALSAWSWKAFDYPVGYGIRLLRYEGDKIAMDIRYAVRPWEAGGETFLSGY